MSELLDLLAANEEAILCSLTEKLHRGQCPTMASLAAGDGRCLLRTLVACCRNPHGNAANDWADALHKAAQSTVPWPEALAGLNCLERAVRFHVLKTLAQKTAILDALGELGAAVDRMRAEYLQRFLAAPPACAAGPAGSASALAECEARKHAILESSLDPIITINHEGVIREFNRAAEQAFGYPRQKVLGTRPSDVLFPPSTSADEQNRIDRYLTAGEGSMLGRRIEVTAVRGNGETFPAETAMTMSQEQGSPVMTFFIRDISDRKKAEQAQAEYAAELMRSNHELEQFAYVASHDLQEPLRKIRTFGDRLESHCGPALDEIGHDCLQRMQNAAKRMQDLIDGLLCLSRVSTRAPSFAPVDLAVIVRDVVADLEVQIEKSGGCVEVGRLPAIEADALQMRQLFQNLIGNALKFCRSEEPPVVKIEGRFVQAGEPPRARTRAPAQCRILVEDNGIGFQQKHAERIFGVFQRLHLRDAYPGTGVGLSICRRIVQRHGGQITAHGTPGRGSAFEILLPAVQPKQKPIPQDREAADEAIGARE